MLETRDAQDTAARRDAQDMAAGRECGHCTSCPMRMGLGVPSRHPLPSKTAAARAWSCGSILSNSSMQHMPLSASINAPASMQNSPVSSSLLTCRAAWVKKGRSGAALARARAAGPTGLSQLGGNRQGSATQYRRVGAKDAEVQGWPCTLLTAQGC